MMMIATVLADRHRIQSNKTKGVGGEVWKTKENVQLYNNDRASIDGLAPMLFVYFFSSPSKSKKKNVRKSRKEERRKEKKRKKEEEEEEEERKIQTSSRTSPVNHCTKEVIFKNTFCFSLALAFSVFIFWYSSNDLD